MLNMFRIACLILLPYVCSLPNNHAWTLSFPSVCYTCYHQINEGGDAIHALPNLSSSRLYPSSSIIFTSFYLASSSTLMCQDFLQALMLWTLCGGELFISPFPVSCPPCAPLFFRCVIPSSILGLSRTWASILVVCSCVILLVIIKTYMRHSDKLL
jgi:hypothetical protein